MDAHIDLCCRRKVGSDSYFFCTFFSDDDKRDINGTVCEYNRKCNK